MIRNARAATLLVGLAGCPGGEDSRFAVIDSTPADGATVAADAEVALTFSEPHDVAACGEGGVHLVVLGASGQVLGWEDYVVRQDTVSRVILEHGGLETGAKYRLAVQTGASGCLSGYGEGVRPFAATFVVE